MKLWHRIAIVIVVVILFMGMAWYFWTNNFSDFFVKRDLNCDSFGLGETILGCDYQSVSNDNSSVTEVVRLWQIIKKSDKVYLRIKRNDSQDKVIHENIFVGNESDPRKVLAVFYLNFKIPPAAGYNLVGNLKTVSELEQLFASEDLKNREAMLIIAPNSNKETKISSLYLYQP